MFKDKYKKDNEFIKPDSKKLNEIEEKIRFSSYEDKKKYFYKKPQISSFPPVFARITQSAPTKITIQIGSEIRESCAIPTACSTPMIK